MNRSVNLVWFKKDLRITDHRALSRSIAEGPTIGLFVYETEWLGSEEFSETHLQFASECLTELKIDLAKKKIFEWRSKPEVKKASLEVLEKHGSRSNPHFPVQKRWQGVK